MASLLSLPVLTLVVLAHLLLLVASRRLNALFLLAAVYLALTQLSVSSNVPGFQAMKYARLYTSLLMVVVGIGAFRARVFRPTSNALLPFLIWYICAGLWSASPFWGLAWKSLFTCAFLGGLALAWGGRDRKDLIQGLRFLTLVTGILGLASLRAAIANPVDSLRGERLAVGGICANTVAVNCAISLALCLYVALHDTSRIWRALAGVFACAHVAIIVAAGSRTGVAVAVFVLLFHFCTVAKRPVYVLAVGACVVGVGLLLAAQVGNELGLDRILHESVEKRWGMLYGKAQTANESPMVGQGAVVISGRDFHALSNVNSHNLYIQIAVELGVIGLAIFLGGMAVVAYRTVQMHRFLRPDPRFARLAVLPPVLLGAILLEGMGSSATLGSTQFTTLFLGFSVGLIDRLPELAIRARRLPAPKAGFAPVHFRTAKA